MVFVSCLYLNQNRSYGQKCVSNIFGDLDLDLDLILTKNNRLPAFTLTYQWVKYLSDILQIVDARVLTDKQTDRQTDKQANKQTDQHTFEKRSFRK